MHSRRVLIVGSGIAGPTLAYWLDKYGFEATLVERSPTLRKGGYVIDFWGAGYDVAEKMELLPAMKALSLPIDDVKFVNTRGKRKGGFGGRAMQSVMGGHYFSILRSDLARTIYESMGSKVRTVFGDTVTEISQSDDGVIVDFRSGAIEKFDLVIGAGGLHSPVRQLVFGPESSFEKYLGYYAASFSTHDYPHEEPRSYVSYAVPGRQVTRYTLQNGRTVFLFVFSSDSKLGVGHQDVATQQDILHERFEKDGWECRDILHRLDSSSDFYFDSVSQIRMNAWSRRRAALVGDSCGCPSLLAGQGSALAMAGAYVLAGELKLARGDHRVAFANYESRFRPVVSDKQLAAEKFAKSFVPKSRTGIFVRNQVTRLMRVPLVADLTMGRMLKDSVALPTYNTYQ